MYIDLTSCPHQYVENCTNIKIMKSSITMNFKIKIRSNKNNVFSALDDGEASSE